MVILVTGANGQLGNEMRIVAKGSKDKYIFTDVCDEHPESIEMLKKLAGQDIETSTSKLDITNIDAGGVGDLLEAMGGCAVFNKYNEISSPTKVITNPAQAHKQGLTSFQAVMVDFLTTDALKQYYYSDNSPKDSALPYDSLKTKAV